MRGWIQFSEPLPSNDGKDIHTDTDYLEGFMKHAVEMASDVITSFIKISSGIQQSIEGRHRHKEMKEIA
jgi:hypothetical protein